MARRKHRRNPRAKYKVRHVVLKKNPRRRLRRNGPTDSGAIEAEAALAASAAGPRAKKFTSIPKGEMMGPFEFVGPLPPARGYRTQQARNRKLNRAVEVKRLRALARRTRKGAKGRGVSAMAKRAQAGRLEAIAAVLAKRGKSVQKSPLVKAMTVRSNPSMQQVAIIAGQAVAATGGMLASAAIGKYVADMIMADKDGVLKADYVKEGKKTVVAKYAPAALTAGASLAVFALASSMDATRKYALGIGLGGMSAAMLQALFASDTVPLALDPNASFGNKAKRVLGLGEYTTVGSGIFHGVGEYTTVGSGIFHGLGEYTTVGQAHPFRPRNFGDDQMQWAATGGLGAMLQDRGGRDNASEFAPGEGGIFAKTPMLSR